MPSAVSPKDIAASLLVYWSPRAVGAVDDTYVTVAQVKGTLAWHSHEHEDELLFILKIVQSNHAERV